MFIPFQLRGKKKILTIQSQLGYHDSELAIVMEDTDLIDSTMDGKPYKAGRHIASLRRALWREHLGLLPAQELDASQDPNAQPPGAVPNDYRPGREDRFVEDPLNDDLWSTWTTQATTNTEIFRQLFRADPDDNIKTFEQYNAFMPDKSQWKQGHLADPFVPVDEVKKKLDKVRGHLVWFPLEFLENAEMAEPGLSVNQFTEVCVQSPKSKGSTECRVPANRATEYLHVSHRRKCMRCVSIVLRMCQCGSRVCYLYACLDHDSIGEYHCQ